MFTYSYARRLTFHETAASSNCCRFIFYMDTTIVIFRKDRTGWKEPFALFPELPADNYGRYCTAFQHVGQHCAADYHGCVAASDPASPEEYHDLYDELEKRGYSLVVKQRATPEMHERRRRVAAEWRADKATTQPASVGT